VLAGTAAQVARLREMAEPLKRRAQEYARQAAASDNVGMTGIARLEAQIGAESAMGAAAISAAADALEREAWCEEMGADVVYSDHEAQWQVLWDSGDDIQQVSAPTRNAAIDSARGPQ
jgi:hypothetical protein